MKQKKKKKAPSTKKTKRVPKKRTKKIATIVKGTDIVQKDDGSLAVVGKNAKMFDGATIERKERQYKFDDRLVPYYLGGDTKEGNLELREVLIRLGKTPEMTDLFSAMKSGNLGYREDAKEIFMKALYAVIKGHDEIGLAHVYEEDIQAIHDNNLKKFNDFWETLSKIKHDDDLAGFSN